MRMMLFSVVVAVCMFAAMASSAAARQCALPSGPPVSKAQYESRLVGALGPARRAGKLAGQITNTSSLLHDAYIFRRVQKIYRRACLAAGRIAAPTEIASLHRKVVIALGALASDAREARIALHKHDRRRYQRALGGFRHYGRRLEHLGKLLTARGY